MKARLAVFLCLLPAMLAIPADRKQNWTHFVRIGGNSLRLDRVDQIVRDAAETNVFGIETDNDIPGRYDSFLDPAEKLKAIRGRGGQSARGQQLRLRLHRRAGMHHRQCRQEDPHVLQGSSGLGAAQDHRRTGRVRRGHGVLDHEGRRGRLDQPLRRRSGAGSTWSACDRSRRRGSTGSTWTSPTG